MCVSYLGIYADSLKYPPAMISYMPSTPDVGRNLTQHQFDARDGPWSHWKYTVLGDPAYDTLGDRLNVLVEADLLCQEEHGTGLVELALEEGLFTEEQLAEIRDIDPVE